MNLETAISIVYPQKYKTTTNHATKNTPKCNKRDPVNTTCFYSEFHECNQNEYGCIFSTETKHHS